MAYVYDGAKRRHAGTGRTSLAARSAATSADVLHLWGADSAAGSEPGRARSEEALRLTNAAAAAVVGVSPGVAVASLAYHGTLAVPVEVRPRRTGCLLWAPRERSYDHPADGAPNAGMWELIQHQVAHYAAADALPPRVFEYYVDAIRFPGGIPEVGAIMAADLAAYAAAGADTLQALMTGAGAWRAPHPNPWLFGHLTWTPGRIPKRFCASGGRRSATVNSAEDAGRPSDRS